METSLCVRLFLLNFSVISLALHITSVVIRSWFGVSIEMFGNGRNVTGTLTGGLFLSSPPQLCVPGINGTDCSGQILLTSSENRTLTAVNQLLARSVQASRILVLVGVTSSTCGFILLYCYLCLSKTANKQRCVGVIAALFWILASFPELTAIGVQMFANFNIKPTVDLIVAPGDILRLHFTAPWALVSLGCGAFLNLVVAIIVALPSCEKEANKTVLRYNKRSKGYKDKFRILDNDDDEYDSDL